MHLTQNHPHTISRITLAVASVIVVAGALIFTGCSKKPSTSTDTNGRQSTLTIVCTTGMVADAVRHVAGEHAEVRGLMGEGVDPHLYKPTRADIQQIMNADVVFINGLLLEGKMTETFERAASAGKRVVALAESIDETKLLSPAEFAGHPDPHVWMSPMIWTTVVETTNNTLSEIDPDHAAQFANNARVYIEQINELHEYATNAVASIPESQRMLVTAHDAFGYFGRQYSMQVVGIQGISTESEAGVRDIERIVSLLVTKNVPAVFVESTVSERNIRALIDGAQAQQHSVAIGGTLFSDAMGKPGTYEGTYIGMIDHNVTTIVRALGGDAPERGMHDKLGKDGK